jgi:hypothetical protein
VKLHVSQVQGSVADGEGFDLLGQVVVHWRYWDWGTFLGGAAPRCIRTYEVFWYDSTSGDPVRVNGEDTVFSSYTHTQANATAHGCYQVAAIDYWGRTSALSTAVCV